MENKHKITIRIPFRAGHRLLPPYQGKCNNVHGEGYTAIVEISTNELDENGMVIDFGDIKKQIKGWIDEYWDHAYICNYKDEIGYHLYSKGLKVYQLLYNPTAEIMAMYLYNIIRNEITPNVTKVGIIESFEDSIGWYEGGKNE